MFLLAIWAEGYNEEMHSTVRTGYTRTLTCEASLRRFFLGVSRLSRSGSVAGDWCRQERGGLQPQQPRKMRTPLAMQKIGLAHEGVDVVHPVLFNTSSTGLRLSQTKLAGRRGGMSHHPLACLLTRWVAGTRSSENTVIVLASEKKTQEFDVQAYHTCNMFNRVPGS